MAKKVRIDQLLLEQGCFPSRSRAQAALMAGVVYIGGQRVDKAGALVSPDSVIEVRGKDCPFVSRGGLKLARALEVFDISVAGLRAVDFGSSTGGFCDCLLQNGALHVVAVDVGKGQLDLKLRDDPRVTVMEETNARYLQPEQLPYRADFVCADLSFISLALLFPVIYRVSQPGQDIRVVCLVKPQFEAGPKNLRKGVVRDPKIHLEVLRRVFEQAAAEGLWLVSLTHSPVKGPAGNIEFVAGFRVLPDNPEERPPWAPHEWEPRLAQAVEQAHRELNPS